MKPSAHIPTIQILKPSQARLTYLLSLGCLAYAALPSLNQPLERGRHLCLDLSLPPTVISTILCQRQPEHSLFSPLKTPKLLSFLPMIPVQIHERLSLKTRLESCPTYSSTPRTLGLRLNRWIVFVTNSVP